MAREFLASLLALPKVKQQLSSDHFSVDGTLLDAWASMKSFRLKDGSGSPPAGGRNAERNFRQEKRSNETHRSTADSDAKLYREGAGQESRLCYLGHVLMENRNGPAVTGDVTQVSGTAERATALDHVDGYRPANGGSPWATTRDRCRELRAGPRAQHHSANRHRWTSDQHRQAA